MVNPHQPITKNNKNKTKKGSSSLRHPRKDNNIISSQARRKAKALGGHCEHIQGRIEAALTLKPGERRKLLGGHCECFEKQAFGFIITNQSQKSDYMITQHKTTTTREHTR
ncbi:hypothetical protein BRARA_H01805 [Brassica rapa]|uniref:Uncharacterized protein n=1 Tax=Brassica campestris TaxID=3711 RepID=A0A397YK94_BRACM|nr:hypothetical protein BRARA_H01805 [Brassica rapa]